MSLDGSHIIFYDIVNKKILRKVALRMKMEKIQQMQMLRSPGTNELLMLSLKGGNDIVIDMD